MIDGVSILGPPKSMYCINYKNFFFTVEFVPLISISLFIVSQLLHYDIYSWLERAEELFFRMFSYFIFNILDVLMKWWNLNKKSLPIVTSWVFFLPSKSYLKCFRNSMNIRLD